MDLSAFIRRHLTAAVFALLGLLALGLYANCLHHPFLIDDEGLFVNNPLFHNIRFLPYQFIPDIKRHMGFGSEAIATYYRPLAHIIPMLCYLAFGPHPLGYHVVNLLLWIGCCFSVFFVIRFLFRDVFLGLATAVAFCIHPMNSLIVNYITASVFAVQVTAMLWAVYFYQKGREGRSGFYGMLTALCFAAALLCHESAVTLPLMLLAGSMILGGDTPGRGLRRAAPFFVLLAGYGVFHLVFASFEQSLLQKILASHITFFEYTASLAKITGWYLSRFFYPYGIVLIWGTHAVSTHLWLWNALLAAEVAAGVFLWKLSKGWPARRWGLAIFFIGFLPVTAACFFQSDFGLIIEPHWLFMPSVGLFVYLASLLQALGRRIPAGVFFALLLAIAGLWGGSTWVLNGIWGSAEGYARYWIRQVPEYKSAYFWLASAEMKKGNFSGARLYYRRALEGKFPDWEIYTNLGLMAMHEGHLTEAQPLLQRALRINPRSSAVRNDLGLLWQRMGETGPARTAFETAIRDNPYVLEPRMNLARMDKERGDLKGAIALYKENLKISPAYGPALSELFGAYLQGGFSAQAQELQDLILSRSRDPVVLTACGSLLAQRGKAREAFSFYQRALKQDPHFTDAYRELGKLFGNLEMWDKAIAVWRAGQSVAPEDKSFGALIARARQLRREQKGHPAGRTGAPDR